MSAVCSHQLMRSLARPVGRSCTVASQAPLTSCCTAGLPCRAVRPQRTTSSRVQAQRRGLFIIAAGAMTLPKTSPPPNTAIEIWVKGSPEGGAEWGDKGLRGDCPFSQRSMMTFEELGISYKPYFIDEQRMPDWVTEVPGLEGKKQIPFIRVVKDDKWMGDSDKFLGTITEQNPNGKKIGTPDSTPDVGTDLMPKFIGFVRSQKGQDEDQKMGELKQTLQGINDHLKKSGKPYIGGDDVCATDLRLAPQLNHVRIGASEIKGWTPGQQEFPELIQWHERVKQRPSWQHTAPDSEQYVREGWQVKMKVMDESEKQEK